MDRLLNSIRSGMGTRPRREQVGCRMLTPSRQSQFHSQQGDDCSVGFLLACGHCPAPARVWEWRELGQEVKSGSPAHPASPLPQPHSQARSPPLSQAFILDHGGGPHPGQYLSLSMGGGGSTGREA